MSSPSKTLRIFISSPGDVHEERDKARRVINALQRYYTGVTLQPVLWEDLALPATASFQETIDFILQKELIDIAVFILWSRLGSPLGPAITRADGSPYRSGTEREFDVMLEAFAQSGQRRPIILAYTRTDESGFRQSLTSCPASSLEELISQRKLAESFIREQFKDAEGHNVRAYHSYREPVSFAQRLHTHLHQVLDELLGEGVAPRWLHEPYRGLEVFDVEHAPIFQGRDEETCDVLQRLRDQEQSGCAFTVIVGASGSGKSSLARAGVAAALTQHAYDDHVKVWRVVTLFPSLGGGDLNRSLVRTLAEQLPELRSSATALDDIASGLAKDAALTVKLSIVPAFARAAEATRGPVRILLLLDQLEELWTDRRITDTDREQFLCVLEALARSGQIAVLATLRSDFYPHAQRIPAFLRLKGDRGHCDLLPPGPAALHRLITEPARLAGLRFEQQVQTGRTLDQLILQDASRDPAALPLLQYALSELYQQRDETNRQLTYAAYQKLGGVEGALGKRAADTFHSLPPEVQAALPDILPLLVTIDIDGEQSAVRRRAQLWTLTNTPARRTLTKALIAARFLTADRRKNTPIVSLAHEALLRRWDKLSQWVVSNRYNLRLRARVEQSQQRWTQQKEDPSLFLPSGLALEEGQILLHNARSLLTTKTARYIERSIDHREAESSHQRLISTIALGASLAMAIIAMMAAFWINRERSSVIEARNRATTEAANAKDHEVKAREQEAIAKMALATAESSAVVLSKQKEAVELSNTKSKALIAGAAQSDLATGNNLWELGRYADAVAYWARAYDYDPESITTSFTIFSHVPTLSFDRLLTTLVGHVSTVQSVAYSPDGTRIVTGSDDNTARIWDSATGQFLTKLAGHKGLVSSVAYSPDGKWIVTGSGDGTARIWYTMSGKSAGVFTGHEGSVLSIVYSPDGTRIVTGSGDKTARVWDIASGKSLTNFTGHEGGVWSVAYSPDGTHIVTGSHDETARIWDAATGEWLNTLVGHEGTVWSVSYSPDGTRIVTGAKDKTLRIWNAVSGKSLTTLTGHKSEVNSVVFSPDGTRIVTGSDDKTARIWDSAIGKSLTNLFGDHDVGARLAYNPDGTRLVAGGDDWWDSARIWDAASGKSLTILTGQKEKEEVGSVAYSPDGTRIVSGSEDKTGRIWDAATGKSLTMLSGHEGGVTSVAYSPNGTHIVTGSEDKTARIWDAASGKSLANFIGHEGGVTSVAYSPDGTHIVTGSGDTTARIWDAASGKSLTNFTGHEGGVTSVAYSPDGTHIVTGSWDKTARIWNAASGKSLTTLTGHEGGVTSVAYSPDGTHIVTGSGDTTARIWDAASGKSLTTLTGHKSGVTSVVFSPDGTRIVTGSRYETARIWDIAGVHFAPSSWFKTFLRFHVRRRHDENSQLVEWPSLAEEPRVLMELRVAIKSDHTRYGDLARYLLTPSPEKPIYPGAKMSCGEGADSLIEPSATRHDLERAYNWHPGHPLVQMALAKFEENTTRAVFLREYGVSRLLKRQPSDQEPAAKIAVLCRRAEALLLDQKDQPRADRVRQRAEELGGMKK